MWVPTLREARGERRRRLPCAGRLPSHTSSVAFGSIARDALGAQRGFFNTLALEAAVHFYGVYERLTAPGRFLRQPATLLRASLNYLVSCPAHSSISVNREE